MEIKVSALLSTLYFSLLIISVNSSCTFDNGLIGTWTSNAFGTITFTSNVMNLGSHSFNLNGKTSTNWTCLNDATTPYVIVRSELFTFGGAQSYAYICMVITAVNSNSYYFYMHSPTNILLGNERIAIYETASTPGVLSTICPEFPSTAEFISMVRQGSESSALDDCPGPLHRNFTYTFNTGTGDRCTANSFVSVCPTRQQLDFDHTKCSDQIAYSAGGSLGCVATIDDGSGTMYASIYNFDTTVNQLTTFRFTCMAVQSTSPNIVQASYAQTRCVANQAYNVKPASGGLISLTPNGTCGITTTTEATTTELTTEATTTAEETTTTESPIPKLTTDSVNVGAIIGGVLGAILAIVLILLLVLYCIHRKKVLAKQREIIDRRLKLFKIKQSEGLEDDEKALNEPSLDPNFPHEYETPRQELIPPVKKSITRDMMSQTDLQKAPKKNIPPPTLIIEKQSTPTPRYLPWPWRTAKRASQKSTFQSQSNLNKFGPISEATQDCISLADYTVSKYGIRYDDTGVDDFENKISRPPTRFIPRSKSVLSVSRASYSRASISRSSSVASLQRSHSMLDVKTPTPRKSELSRASSLKSLQSFTERTQTNILMSIQEKKEKQKSFVEEKKAQEEHTIRPIPHYMFPIRSRSVVQVNKTLNKNPLAKSLRRSKTDLRPIPTKANKLAKLKDPVKKKKKKKIKVFKKKKSPYSVIPTPVRQITLLPLNQQKPSNNKVKPADVKVKQRPKLSPVENFTVGSPSVKSPKTTDSVFTRSPDTLLSSDNNGNNVGIEPKKSDTFITKTDFQSVMENTQSTDENRTVDNTQTIKTATTDFQDSGISADESSLDKPKSEYEQTEQKDEGTLKLPKLNLDFTQKPEVDTTKSTHKDENLKLPLIEKKQKSTVRPWR